LTHVLEQVQHFSAKLTEEDLGQEIVRAASDVFDFQAVRLRLLDEFSQELVTVAVESIPTEDVTKLIGHRVPRLALAPLFQEKHRVEGCFLIDHDYEVWDQIPSNAFYHPPIAIDRKGGWGVRDSLIAPLIAPGGDWKGLLTLDIPRSGQHPPSELIKALEVFASAVAEALSARANFGRVVQEEKNVREFVKSLAEIAKHGNLSKIAPMIVHAGANLLNAEGCSLYLVEDKFTELKYSTFQKGGNIERRKPVSQQDGAGLTAYVAATGDFLNFRGCAHKKHPAWAGEEDQLVYLESRGCKSLLIVPVIDRHNRCVGVLSVENKKGSDGDEGFDGRDVDLLKLIAEQTVIAIEMTNLQASWERSWIYHGMEDDLHEIINWFHSGIVLITDAALEWLRRGDVDQAIGLIAKVANHARTGNEELRSIHRVTRTPMLEQEGLPAALQRIADEWKARLHPDIQVSVSCPFSRRLPPSVEYSLYRIAQVALSNAATHSRANRRPDKQGHIWITLRESGEEISLSIGDNGEGFNPTETIPGYGLSRMKYWADQAKAILEIESAPGCGTTVTARVMLGKDTP
jgi:GAF domain-containing protein